MNSVLWAGIQPPAGPPPIDPSSTETDETIAAIITRTETGKLTVARRDTHRPTETPETPSEAPDVKPSDPR